VQFCAKGGKSVQVCAGVCSAFVCNPVQLCAEIIVPTFLKHNCIKLHKLFFMPTQNCAHGIRNKYVQ